MSYLELLRKEAFYCVRCRHGTLSYHLFLPLCPSYDKFKFEGYSCRGRMELAQGILQGSLKYTPQMVESLYKCTACGACEVQCEESSAGRDFVKVMEAMRADAVEMGIGPMAKHRLLGRSIVENHNPYGEPYEKRSQWIPRNAEVSNKADLIYFVGCTARYRQQEIAQAQLRILNAVGVKVAVMDEEWCCGSPLFRIGQPRNAEQVARHNVEAIERMEARKVVTACAGCIKTIKEDYPGFVGKLNFEVVHSSELLRDLMVEGRLDFKKPIEKALTYHDPCHLGRALGIYDPPRDVLAGIPGLRLVEMERRGKASWCCGAGGGVKSAFPDWAVEVATARLNDAREAGVDVVASACPFCKRNLMDAVKVVGGGIEVYDMVELVEEAMDVRTAGGGG